MLRRRPAGRVAGAAIVALLAVAPPIAAQGPEPDTVPEVPARPPYVPPAFSVSVTFGTASLGTIQRQPALARRTTAGGTTVDSTFLGRSIEGGSALQLSVSTVVSLSPAWALRLGATAGRATFRPEYRGAEGDELYVDAARALADAEETDVTAVGVEGALRLRIPSSRRVQPYLELGGTVTRWTAEDVTGATADLADAVHRIGGLAGAGVLVPLGRRLTATAAVTSNVYRTVIDPASAGTAAGLGSTLAIELAAPPASAFADGALELTTSVRLQVGLSARFGAAGPPPPARSAPPVSTSPPGPGSGPGR